MYFVFSCKSHCQARQLLHVFRSINQKVPLGVRFEELIFLIRLIKSYLSNHFRLRLRPDSYSSSSCMRSSTLWTLWNQNAEVWSSPWISKAGEVNIKSPVMANPISNHTHVTRRDLNEQKEKYIYIYFFLLVSNEKAKGPETTHFPSARLTFLKTGYISGVGCPWWSSYRKTGDWPTSSPNCWTPWAS